MNDIDIARQLVAYVDATTDPTVHPENTTDAEIIMLDTRTDRNPDREETARRRTWRWPAVAAALLAVALIGSLVVIARSGDDTATTDAVEFGLVGGEAASDLSGLMGWGFADEPLTEISSPGPTLEVEVGEEVTVTFTNEHGWSQDPEDAFFESVDQSFRVVTPGQIGDVKFGAEGVVLKSTAGDHRWAVSPAEYERFEELSLDGTSRVRDGHTASWEETLALNPSSPSRPADSMPYTEASYIGDDAIIDVEFNY